ncbi:hypothetical protein E3Q18_03223 [Wallemia mellicola]|uniref:F-box domain-containing protein n=1 Tax=Wallemia mellicola TaxID=1708541 RepID=A0A4T0PVA5_9BASI|nr:hypothetical protein E3Q18_03223 [Wallemia mellicola]TIB97856.1 hypothetical protein E3Q17_03232 [Wallemia mellicola]TIC15165.1 hypothetical protein E3Q13_03408 [Wallemia mellicola]
MKGFLDLPNEVLSQIIDNYLDLNDIYLLRICNKRLLELSRSIVLNSIQMRLFGLTAGVHTTKVIESGLFSSRNCQSVHSLSLIMTAYPYNLHSGPPNNEEEEAVAKEMENSMDFADESEISELIVRLQRVQNVRLHLSNTPQWKETEKEAFQRLLYSLATLRRLKDLTILSPGGLWEAMILPPIQTLESLTIRGDIPNKAILGSCVENSRALRQLRLPNDDRETSEALEGLSSNTLPALEFYEGRSDDIVELTNENVAPNLKRLRYIPHKEGDSSLEEVQSTLSVLEGRPLSSFAYETLFTMQFNEVVNSLTPFKETLTSLAIGNTNALAPPELTLEERLIGEIRFSSAFVDNLPRLTTVCLTYATAEGMPHLPSGNSGTTTLPDGSIATYFDRVAALWFKQLPTLCGVGMIFLDGTPSKAWYATVFGIDQKGESLDVDDSWRRYQPFPEELALPAIQSWIEEL